MRALGACRTWGVESENRRFRQNRPQRDQFLPDLQPNSRAIGQKDGKKWAAAADLQPTIRKSDRLLDEALAIAGELHGQQAGQVVQGEGAGRHVKHSLFDSLLRLLHKR